MQWPLIEQQHCARECVRCWEQRGDSLQEFSSWFWGNQTSHRLQCNPIRTRSNALWWGQGEDSGLWGSREGFLTLSFLSGWQERQGSEVIKEDSQEQVMLKITSTCVRGGQLSENIPDNENNRHLIHSCTQQTWSSHTGDKELWNYR